MNVAPLHQKQNSNRSGREAPPARASAQEQDDHDCGGLLNERRLINERRALLDAAERMRRKNKEVQSFLEQEFAAEQAW